MVRVRAIGLGMAAAAVVSVVAVVPTSQAASVKVSGSLRGARLPSAAAGVSLVQALDLSDGTMAASQYLGRRARFSLKVPPGPYALVAGSVFKGRRSPTLKLVG